MIVPAIIPKSLEDLKEKLNLVSFAPAVQIDLVDGKFVENIAWPYEPAGQVVDAYELLQGKEIELDLMVSDPVSAAKEWLALGVNRLVFHLENLPIQEVLDLKNHYHFSFGLSFNIDTPLSDVEKYLNDVDFVQLMGIKTIGSQGQPFDERVIDIARNLHDKYPDLVLSADGAMNADNIFKLKSVGVTRFAVGSVLLNSPDPRATYEQLLKIATN